MTNLLKLSDCDLNILKFELTSEMSRRKQWKNGEMAEIRGCDAAKRAILVAACGKHSMVFVGAKGTGKTLLRSLADKLGAPETYETWGCPCGQSGGRKPCSCTEAQIKSFKRKNTVNVDIWVEILPLLPYELSANSSYSIQKYTPYKEKIDSFVKNDKLAFTTDANSILKNLVSELSLNNHETFKIIEVAKTIAQMECQPEVAVSALCEAVIYRELRGW